MKTVYIITILLLIMALMWFMRPRRSGMAQFRGKKPEDTCEDGWTELAPEICTRDD